ncbi:MAG TPA: membrane protein insertase YidC, partial [Acidiferrobacterales bacterium]|nr:membrane protein insertase YidC [Acidiferrobacterales bacterium]
MNDIRRTLLWVVFSMSLVLLWDAWNKHTGQPSIFGSSAVKQVVSSPPPGVPPASQVGVPTPVAAVIPGAVGLAASAPAGAVPASSGATSGEVVVVTTDLVKASFDSRGGNLVRLELLHHRDVEDRQRNVLLFDQSAERSYAAQSGLVATQAGVALPNHYSLMTRLPGTTTLADGANELQVRFESGSESGVKLSKIYSFKRGDYSIGVRHEALNTGT